MMPFGEEHSFVDEQPAQPVFWRNKVKSNCFSGHFVDSSWVLFGECKVWLTWLMHPDCSYQDSALLMPHVDSAWQSQELCPISSVADWETCICTFHCTKPLEVTQQGDEYLKDLFRLSGKCTWATIMMSFLKLSVCYSLSLSHPLSPVRCNQLFGVQMPHKPNMKRFHFAPFYRNERSLRSWW